MFAFLPAALRGTLSLLLLSINTVAHATPVFIIALAKLLIPAPSWRQACNRPLDALVRSWCVVNDSWIRMTQQAAWLSTELPESLSRDRWYLMTCNHQSWADIFISQRLLNQRIPPMKFFLKQQLIWVPVIGLAWWALDFPFMKRYSRQDLKKHPEKRGRDFATTLKACRKFRDRPVTMVNFMEGTRFSRSKQQRQESPYRSLLRPRPGGTGYVLSAMGSRLEELIDITIYYPDGVPGFWDFLCGEKCAARLDITLRAIPAELLGRDYATDRDFRNELQQWLNELWTIKDQTFDSLAGVEPSSRPES